MEETEFESLRGSLRSEGNNNHKIAIVDELERLNKKAILFMQYQINQRMSYKRVYGMLQRSTIWKEARKLLKEYYTEEGKIYCHKCKKEFTTNGVLHHIDFYQKKCLFHPLYVRFLCSQRCHTHYKGAHKR